VRADRRFAPGASPRGTLRTPKLPSPRRNAGGRRDHEDGRQDGLDSRDFGSPEALQEFVTGPLTPAQYPGDIASTLGNPAVVPLFVAEYPLADYPSPSIALGALGTDGIFACNARLSAQRLSAHVPTFEYEFNDANAPQRFLPPVSFPYGAYHAAEIQYLFGLATEIPAPALSAAQEQLSDNMVRYWTQFARSGNPNSPDTPPFWPSYEKATDQIQSLVPPTPQTETGFAADHKCAFWASLGG
jgi:para-nitrobenzyl esterase